ncbi:C2HC-type zinc finger protein, partial [Mycobacterium tuberculosis]
KKDYHRNNRSKTYTKRYTQKKRSHNNEGGSREREKPTCYRCGKKGHYANRCRQKRRIRKIQDLEIDEKHKEEIMKIILSSESEEINSDDS